MKRIAVIYATREGQTRKIAGHVAEHLRAAGADAREYDLSDPHRPEVVLSEYAGVVLAGSVHQGKHEKELSRFVKENRDVLEQMPTALLSVSLSQAGVDRTDYTEEERSRAAADVQRMITDFEAETGWHPGRVKPAAGALMYSKYNLLIRFVMRRIARKAKADTDSSRDYEYTDWASLDRFANEFAMEVASQSARPGTPALPPSVVNVAGVESGDL